MYPDAIPKEEHAVTNVMQMQFPNHEINARHAQNTLFLNDLNPHAPACISQKSSCVSKNCQYHET
jgi:hypothetical protein